MEKAAYAILALVAVAWLVAVLAVLQGSAELLAYGTAVKLRRRG
ncbi:MAG: hypothetical protein VX466_12325 [Myxococcota bacterium]|nr:hypothetical protein [Myxococcota bacterium]